MSRPKQHERRAWRVKATVYPDAVVLEYAGSLAVLLEIGAITREQYQSLREHRRGRVGKRVDADGDAYSQLRRPSRACPDYVCLTLRIRNPAKALRLPGAREAMGNPRGDHRGTAPAPRSSGSNVIPFPRAKQEAPQARRIYPLWVDGAASIERLVEGLQAAGFKIEVDRETGKAVITEMQSAGGAA